MIDQVNPIDRLMQPLNYGKADGAFRRARHVSFVRVLHFFKQRMSLPPLLTVRQWSRHPLDGLPPFLSATDCRTVEYRRCNREAVCGKSPWIC